MKIQKYNSVEYMFWINVMKHCPAISLTKFLGILRREWAMWSGKEEALNILEPLKD